MLVCASCFAWDQKQSGATPLEIGDDVEAAECHAQLLEGPRRWI